MKNAKTSPIEPSLANGASATHNRKLVRRGPSPMALEQRFMFDGAALADASQTVAGADAAASHDVAVSDSHQTDTAAAVTAAAVPAAPPAPAPELMHVVASAQETPAALAQAQADAERLISAFLQQPDARAQLFELFHGSQSQPSAEWLQAADGFLASFQDGAAPVQVELRSHAEMQGAMAAFAAHGPDGQPVIYLNGDWAREVATPQALTRALLEEYGHRIDASLNGDADTAGDEGEAFALRALGAAPDADQAARIAAEDDHDTLQIDGRTVEVEQAAITFSVVYQGTPSSWSEEAQNLALYASPFNGSNYRFTSSNPSDLYFQGNNVTGYLSYQDQSGNRQQIYGVVSRLFKTGSTIDGFYFYAPGADGLINGVGDSAYLLAITPSKFAGGISYGTSSDPVDTAMNKFIPPNSAPVAGNDSASVLEDGSVSGNLLSNDSDANGDTLRVAQFSVSNQTYTVALGGSSTVALASVGSLTVGSNGGYSFTPVANYAGAVPLVTYTVTDGSASASASLSVAIVGVNDAPDGADRTIATREDTAYVFSAADFGFTDRNDTPANALEAVKISSLPTQGTLLFNGVAITASQVSSGYFVAVADIGKLSFRPAANQAASASFTFQVRDNGGTANGGVNLDPVANTITFAIASVNDAPVAVADAVTAGEAGGSANGTAGTDPTGNVLANDTDPDAGDSKSVVSASSAAAASTAVATNTVLAGRYGTLTISSTGAYRYAVDNANATVQALRLSGDTLTDTFTYVMKDGGGLTSSSTLAVTITGANDAPVAVNDLGSAKEAGSTSAYPGSNATGNVLANDTDVDAGDTATLTQIFATANGVSTGGGSTTSTTFRVADVTGIETSNLVFRADGATRLGRVLSFTDDDGSGPGTAGTIVLDAAYTVTNGETLQFSQTAGNSSNFVSNGLATTTAIVAGASSTVQLSGTYGTVLIGMTVTGTGNATDPTVTAINRATNVVTLSSSVTLSTSTALRFVALPGSSILGQRGTLNIAANGAYTYAITDNSLSAGQTFDETFTYQMRDSAGLTSAAVLTVRIEGTTNDTEPDARPNTDTATEAGGVGNTAGAVNPAGNVLSDDLGTSLVVSAAWSEQNPTSASVAASTTSANGLTIAGNYGSLKLGADGSYVYTVNNGNAAVQALNSGGALTDLFFYRAANGSGTDVSTLKITINGSNDAPVAADDFANAAEAGGTGNATPGYDATGNVLANDTDVDNTASSRTVTAVRLGGVEGSGTAGVVGGAFQGSYGTLTLQADGSYRYAVDNSNAAVNALAAGATLVERFNYTVSDGSASDVAVLAITINGANDAPLNTMPAGHVQYDYEQAQIGGLSVHDVDGNLAAGNTVTLSVGQGSLSVVPSGSAVASGSGTAASPLVLSGSESDINATLATLRYQPAANHSGQDTLKMVTQDSLGLSDTDFTSITVQPDDRALTVNDVLVNEGSPYAVFTVGGQAGQLVRLAIANGSAASGSDFSGNLEYYDGSAWAAYTGAAVAIPGSGGASTLLVRAAILNDQAYEGAETFTLTASNVAAAGATGTATIVDDGSGNVYRDSATGAIDAQAIGDDDRPLTVSNVEVNEASPYAVFKVGGAGGQLVSLTLANGNASDSDHGTSLQYLSGASWLDYNGPVAMTGAEMLVRVAITQDGVYEGRETFNLSAANTGGLGAHGEAAIYDDGTGSIYLAGSTTGMPDAGGAGFPAALDDDRVLSVQGVRVNEASDYAVFTVSGTAGQFVSLNVVDGSASIAQGQTLQVWNGSGWTDYNGMALPEIGADGHLLVRVNIVAEHDAAYEFEEDFRLQATFSPANGSAVREGIGIIADDGSGQRFGNGVSGGLPQLIATGLDDDRLLAASDVTVSEASPYAVFTVSGTPGQVLSLALQATGSGAGFATPGTDTGTALQYFDGSNWIAYSGSVTMTGGSLLVRMAVTQDSVYEGPETFRLVATNSSGKTSTGGIGAIRDDGGSSTVFSESDTTSQSGSSDDDRALAISDVTVSEASPYAVFTISGTPGQVLNLTLQATGSGAGFATPGTDTGTALQYFDGSNWTAYSGSVTMSGSSLLVRTAITQDSLYEGAETFRLLATNSSGKTSTGGTGTIRDDGGSTTVFNETDTTPQAGASDDDRALAVSDVTVSEASPYAVFTVSGTPGQVLSLALQQTGSGAGFAMPGTDTGTTLEIFDGSAWVGYSGSVTMTGSSLLVRTAINQDGVYEGAETFRLLATSTSGVVSVGGTATIRDDGGSSTVFNETDTTPQTGSSDDDRALAVSDVTVSEASPYAVFTVSGTPGQVLNLTLQAAGSGAGFATPGIDTGAALQYFDGSNWAAYSGSVTMTGSSLLVRVAVTQDSVYEGPETFRLLATNSSGKTSTGGTGTLRDDGGSTTVFNETDTTPQAGAADDDRALAISDVTVSEASPYAVFTISGTPGQVLSLALQQTGSGAGFATPGTDTGTALQYWTGSAWASYSGSVTMTGSSLLVRVAVTQDGVYEGLETFRLLATNSSGKTSTGGIGALRDDGGSLTVFNETDTTPQSGSSDDDRALAISDVTVSEASPYAVFTVNGTPGQVLNLALQATGSGAGFATLGTDIGTALQYFDGSNWAACNGSVTMTGSSLLVRTTINQDGLYEGPETFRLLATNSSGKTSTGGTGTIRDDGGSTTVFNETDTTPQAGASDDDRSLAISDVTVSEASPYAVFTISGTPGQVLNLSLQQAGSGAGFATPGTDTGATLQYFDGSNWVGYSGSVTMTGGSLLVRTAIIQDSLYEGPETFRLLATNSSGKTSTGGTGTIRDDGASTTVFNETDTTPQTGASDDDRTLVISDVTVSEASPYAVFTVNGTPGQVLNLELRATGSGAGYATPGTDTGTTLEIFDGSAWVGYSGSVTMTGSSLLVRTAINQDGVYEGAETFRLLATSTSGIVSVGGTATIRDDGGSSTVFNETDTTPQTGSSDDDRALAVSDVTVSEASPYAVFTISGTPGQVLNLTLQAAGSGAGFATPGIDTGAALQYFDGNNWAAYSGSVTMTGGSLLVRVAVTQDSVYEGPETFRLLATNSSGKTSTGGTGTIRDDGGSTTVFNETDTTPQAGASDDDRSLAISDVTASEASPYVVFTVSGTPGQVLNLSLQQTGSGAGFATPGTDTGTALQYWTGSAWASYSGSVTMTGSSLLVRVAVTQDSVYEGAETFRLLATNSSGKTSTGGIATIRDDGGSLTVFNETDTTPQSGSSDDDRALAISDVTVSEASPYAVFTISGTPGQVLNLALQATGSGAGFATPGIDTGAALQYFDGSAWVAYSGSVTMTGSSLLVRVAVTQDSVYEGAETFRLLATNSSGKTSTGGTGTIRDDGGSTTVFNETDTTPQAGASDDDRSLAISDVTVSEASPYAVFTVSGTPGQVLSLALQETGSGAGFATQGADTGTALQYFDGSNWIAYSGSVTMTGGSLLVRVAVTQDSVYEGPETFRLVATNSSGKTSTGGTGTIRDDGDSTTVFNETDTTPQAGASDDDRSLAISDVTVSETSPYAVFTVSGTPGQVLNLSLQQAGSGAGFATPGTDTGATLQYFDGSNWVGYSGSVTMTGGSLLVRTAIIQDSLYEGPETFRLLATNSSGKTSTGGTGTIRDDGASTTVFNETDTTPQTGASDDDRTLVISDVTVSEASPYAVFTISGTPGQVLNLELRATGSGAGFATPGTDTGTTLEIFDGSAWVGYSGGVTMTGSSLLVRTAINQDGVYEGAETFRLLATSTSGVVSVGGTATIRDDGGSNTVFNETDTTPQTGSSDDDRALAVSDVTVSEASPYAVFRVTGAAGQKLTLALASGSATVGSDTGTALQYFDGAAWRDYTPGSLVAIAQGSGTLLVRVAIVNDSLFEGSESFRLIATNRNGEAGAGTATLKDDGSSREVYLESNTDGRPTTGEADDDQARPQAVAQPVPPAPAAPAPAPVPEAPAVQQAAPFNSTLVLTDVIRAPDALRSEPIGDLTTSGAGFQIPVVEGDAARLSTYRSVADQFVEGKRSVTFTLPYDAFVHTRAEATVVLAATLTNGESLPAWIRFDARSGSFSLNPPPDFTGEMEVKVIARDNEGREAATVFRLFVGEDKAKLPARSSLSEQIRLAGKRSSPFAALVRGQEQQGQRQQPLKLGSKA